MTDKDSKGMPDEIYLCSTDEPNDLAIYDKALDETYVRYTRAPIPPSADTEGEKVEVCQIRHWDSNQERWSEWEILEPRTGMTLSVAIKEIEDFIAAGFKYELRRLYARPTKPEQDVGALFPDKHGNGGFIQDLCYTIWEKCQYPTHPDGKTDWFNDTLPIVQVGLEKIRAAIARHKEG